MAWGKWADLAYDDEEQIDNSLPSLDKPEYPYGTRICLCGRELEKLGLPLPRVGDMIDLRAMAAVTSVSDDGKTQRVELQIQMLKTENEDTESEDDE